MQAEFEVDYPLEVEEKLMGKKLLFKVSRIVGLTFNGLPCYQVLRVCSDLEVMEMFHSSLVVTTPLKVCTWIIR